MLPWLDLRSALPWLGAATLLVCAITVRVLQTVTHTHERRPKPSTDEASLAVFLGSGACMPSLPSYSNAELTCAPRAGGHTAEMMRLVAHLDWQRFRRRVWIVSSGDSLSETKALELEKQIGTGEVRCDVGPARCTLAQLFDASSFASSASLAHERCTSPTSPRPSPHSSRSLSASGTSRSHRSYFRAAVDDESSQTSCCSTDREVACRSPAQPSSLAYGFLAWIRELCFAFLTQLPRQPRFSPSHRPPSSTSSPSHARGAFHCPQNSCGL